MNKNGVFHKYNFYYNKFPKIYVLTLKSNIFVIERKFNFEALLIFDPISKNIFFDIEIKYFFFNERKFNFDTRMLNVRPLLFIFDPKIYFLTLKSNIFVIERKFYYDTGKLNVRPFLFIFDPKLYFLTLKSNNFVNERKIYFDIIILNDMPFLFIFYSVF